MSSDTLRLRDLNDQHVVVWGFGEEGQAAVRLLHRHAHPKSIAVVVDGAIPAIPESMNAAMESASMHSTNDSATASVVRRAQSIVKSPGVSPYNGSFAESQHSALVTGGTALWFAETGGQHTIGVTGSKGKSTTTSLVAHLLASVGRDVVLAGNVGRALLDVLDEALSDEHDPKLPTYALPDVLDEALSNESNLKSPTYALELSSFQCSELRHSPEVGVLTSLFPEHLDWHGSVDRYYADKVNLFAHRPDVSVAANTDNPTVAARAGSIPGAIGYGSDGANGYFVDETQSGPRIRTNGGDSVFDLGAVRLPGRHNAINIAGALTALRVYGIDMYTEHDALQEAINSFHPLEHRLQPVGEVRGRLVIDDSLSTAPQAAVAALASFEHRAVAIIVGGHDRGLDYQPLADALANRSAPTWVCGVPLSGERIIPLIDQCVRAANNTHVIVKDFDDFDDAVHYANATVPDGGVILLSPAAPSFGRFLNYRDRGLHFRSLLGIA
jgi:UDP-N-acetylmuramoyl-L-alanine---L-glutamate ligase